MKRRMIIAAVTAAALTTTVIAPVNAQDTESPSPSASPTPTASTTADTPEPTPTPTPSQPAEPTPTEDPDDKPGSSFMGPWDLFEHLTGSSVPDGIRSITNPSPTATTPTTTLNPDDYPTWMHSSLFPSEETKTVLAVLELLLAVATIATQLAVFIVPFVPGARDAITNALANVGVYK